MRTTSKSNPHDDALENSGSNNNGSDDNPLEKVDSEEQDSKSSPASYDVLVYPSDPTLELLFSKWQKKDIFIPSFQRRFVWNQARSSKLIESFLLGLPVPPAFMYEDRNSGKLLVVDGQQRLKSIAYFFEGFFGEEDRVGKRPVFRLTGLNEESPFANKSYKDLETDNPAAFRRLNDAVLRLYVIKQLNPKDDTSIYHIFERLNTGGVFLQGQEIRNCIYHGEFNDLLVELNKLQTWRRIFGKQTEDKRQRDVELILRFFALFYNYRSYEKPMKDFLSRFMSENQNPPKERLEEFRRTFTDVVNEVLERLGEKPFHIRAGLNAAVLDSTLVAFAKHLGAIPKNVVSHYKKMIKDDSYDSAVRVGTTDKTILSTRMRFAEKALFGTHSK